MRAGLTMLTLLLAACPAKVPVAEPEPSSEPEPSASEEMAAKKAVSMPGPWTDSPIDWAAARRDWAPLERAMVQRDHHTMIADIPVPVLLPADPELLASLELFTGPGWYAATMRNAALQVMIRGTRHARSAAMGPAERQALGDPGEARITVTEGLVTCSFSAAGAAYTIELECTGGAEAPPCTSEGVTALWKGLHFAGGSEP